MKKVALFFVGILFVWACKSQQQVFVDQEATQEIGSIDSTTGLKVDANLMHVQAHCTSCHSAKMITMNRFTREGWKEKIVWMQKTQNLWDLGEAEPLVLDYLEKNYSPQPQQARRKNLEGVEWYELE